MLHDPFDTDVIKKAPKGYESQLSVNGSPVMGEIVIPQIDVKLPIYHGTSQTVLEAGCGHLEGTSLPVGGKSTNSVITGHTGLRNKKLFTDLELLSVGGCLLHKGSGRKAVLPCVRNKRRTARGHGKTLHQGWRRPVYPCDLHALRSERPQTSCNRKKMQ